MYSYLNVRDQVSHPHKTTGKGIVLYILIFMFLYSKHQDRRFWTKWQKAFPEFNLPSIRERSSDIFVLFRYIWISDVGFWYVLWIRVTELRRIK
jgi:hypothetical protein